MPSKWSSFASQWGGVEPNLFRGNPFSDQICFLRLTCSWCTRHLASQSGAGCYCRSSDTLRSFTLSSTELSGDSPKTLWSQFNLFSFRKIAEIWEIGVFIWECLYLESVKESVLLKLQWFLLTYNHKIFPKCSHKSNLIAQV